MFRDLSKKGWVAKIGVRKGSLESFGGKGEIKIHGILRNLSVTMDLQRLSCFFTRPGNRGLVLGLMMSPQILMFST